MLVILHSFPSSFCYPPDAVMRCLKVNRRFRWLTGRYPQTGTVLISSTLNVVSLIRTLSLFCYNALVHNVLLMIDRKLHIHTSNTVLSECKMKTLIQKQHTRVHVCVANS